MSSYVRIALLGAASLVAATSASADYVYQFTDTFDYGPTTTAIALHLGAATGTTSSTINYYFGGTHQTGSGEAITFYAGDGGIGGDGDFGGNLQSGNDFPGAFETFHTVTPLGDPYGVSIDTSSFPTGDAYATVKFTIGANVFEGVAHFDTNDRSGSNRAVLRDVSYDLVQGALSPAPEPATWAMMVLGFGAVGGTVRRRGAMPITA